MNSEHRESESEAALKERNLIEAARLQNVRLETDSLFGSTCDFPGLVHAPGTMVGAYKLLEKIGEGGFGVVYAAHQTEPIRRKVALKIIKPGMDTKEVIARFDAERQALALMDHTNIARVLDAGATDSGHPYFVMELVRGVAITDYCDQGKLNIRQRLELFVSICQAVQHAHQNGIIHRDIKPRNVMVELQNEAAVPKIIDFGVAKATNQQLTEKTIHTLQAQMIGTPMYMSPEQAAKSGLEVDTRTDIYSLGVLLYEILTGTTPVDKQRLQHANPAELIKIICHEEPPKPSTQIDVSSDLASTISEQRSTEPRKLRYLLRGDLDWIVLKALEKDRTRRYESAKALAEDLQRYLKDQSVEARPPSTIYKFRKLAQKNRALVATIFAMIAMLIVGVFVSQWSGNGGDSAPTKTAETILPVARFIHIANSEDMGSPGVLFENGPVREDDDLRIDIEFERPSYCFLLAVNPDGAVQLCYPEEAPDLVQKDPIQQLGYPEDENQGFPFTDGAGQQAFIIVESSKPLPSFRTWSATIENVAQAIEQTKGRWIWNDHVANLWIDQQTRGTPRDLKGGQEFERFFRSIESANHNLTLYAVSFSVEPH